MFSGPVPASSGIKIQSGSSRCRCVLGSRLGPLAPASDIGYRSQVAAHRATRAGGGSLAARGGGKSGISWRTGRDSHVEPGKVLSRGRSAPGGDSIVRRRKSSRCHPSGGTIIVFCCGIACLSLPLFSSPSLPGGEKEETELPSSPRGPSFSSSSPPPLVPRAPYSLYLPALRRLLHLFVSTRFNEF